METSADPSPQRFEVRALAELERRATEITVSWLDQLRSRLPEQPHRIFPDTTLLNGIPKLLGHLFQSILNSTDPTHSRFVDEELRALSMLRRSQGYLLDEIVAEFEMLRALILEALVEFAAQEPEPLPAREALEVAVHFEAAYRQIVETTAATFADQASGSRQGRAELLTTFGRAVTHELRNRLNAATVTLELYRRLTLTEPGGNLELLDQLASALRKVDQVVPDVFSVAMAQGHHANTEGNFEPLNELIEVILEDLGDLAASRSVVCRVGGELPDFPVDATRLQLVLINLLTNAIKYSDPDKQVRFAEVCATRTRHTPREWRIDVRDNGVGIDPELQDCVFEEHLRAQGSESESGEGLGLSLARSAVFQIGGRIWYSSRPGIGSTFSFTLSEPASGLGD